MLILLIIAFSLSMDSFSLSLAYGTLNLTKKTIIVQSIIVGIYHFIMPTLGFLFGKKVLSIIPIKTNYIVFIVLFIIGIQMIIETFKEEKTNNLNIKNMIIFGFAVSIDSFSVGIGLETIYPNVLISKLVFMIISFVFTYLGLMLGKKINNIVGRISTILGGLFLIIIGILYII